MIDDENGEVDQEFMDSLADDGDYIFVIDGAGKLKSYALPEDLDEDDLPASVQKIMKIFSSQKMYAATIH